MISKIEKCREAIVPVTCGGQTGTAFFIESNRLLTAWHVVSDYFLCRTKIVIVVNGQPIECEAEGCKEKDLAILSCNLVKEVTPIGLLCARFREGAEYTILGFPNELGNGIDDLAIVVRTQSKKSDSLSDFDVVVKRIKGAEVISYCGFSGSPVLNDFGFAVGVVTDQLYGTLGYRSLISVVEWLKTNGIVSIIEREAEYDMRKIGLGRSIQFLNESLLRVGNRYNKRLHVQNQNFEKKLDYFAEIGKDEDLKVIISSYQKFYEELQLDQKQKLANFTSLAHFLESGDVIDNFWQDVESINVDIIGEDAERHYTYYQRQYWSEFFANIESILSRNSYCDARFLRINGKAGTGKTHQLCQWAYSASKKCRVYLFFSTQFLERRTPWETMLELLGWEEEDFDKLDQELGAEKEQAVFIIDALNEGAGTYYWQNNLQNLVEHIKRYLHVKLIVSVRNFEKNDVMSRAFGQEWDNVTINGFEDPKKAVSMYFNDYGISEDVDRYLKIPDFRTPLFLKIYCEAYRSFTKEERRGMNRLIMYERYLKTRNDEVSKKIDEDPKRNVTSKYLHSIGELSLYRYLGMNVPRDNAISIGRRLCPLRLWSKDLYHNLVAENLLKEYPVAEDCYVTDFEYDSLGDYIRASQVLRKYSDDSSAHDAILRIKSLITDERVCLAGKDRLRHVLVAFFSVWNPKKEIWMKCVSDSYLAPYVMEAWMCRSHDEKNDTFTDDVIRDVVSRYSNFTSAEFVCELLKNYNIELFEEIHRRLLSMSMSVRDQQWTISVNHLLDDYRLEDSLFSYLPETDDDYRKQALLYCWCFTSSHPRIRYTIVKHLLNLFIGHSSIISYLVERMKDINDPYVLQGLYASIYGWCLISRNKSKVTEIAQSIQRICYPKKGIAPSEINVRRWSLKIIEFHKELTLDSTIWDAVQPPYKPIGDLLAIPANEQPREKNYFGQANGAWKLHNSLFFDDFSRYIIGTNSRSESDCYYVNGEAVLLSKIEDAIAYRIKNVYGYSENIEKYDNTVPWESRTYHTVERIGKKYQWIGLGEVYANMMDLGQVKVDSWSKDFADIPYPWYGEVDERLDPTLKIDNNVPKEITSRFEPEIVKKDLYAVEENWTDQREDYPVFNPICIDIDGVEWVALHCYYTHRMNRGKQHREEFLLYNACIIHSSDKERFEGWASTKNFHGRWMPEDYGQTDYLWNEYPWADCCKQHLYLDWDDYNTPCPVSLPYRAQLQEDLRFVEDEGVMDSTLYAPNPEMFEMFGLYTAERGVVRNQNAEVVAINRNVPNDVFRGLVVRRDILNRYLKEKDLILMYGILGERQEKLDEYEYKIQRLSGCVRYEKDCAPYVIQPLQDERDLPIPPKENVESKPDEIESRLSEFLKKLENYDADSSEIEESKS